MNQSKRYFQLAVVFAALFLGALMSAYVSQVAHAQTATAPIPCDAERDYYRAAYIQQKAIVQQQTQLLSALQQVMGSYLQGDTQRTQVAEVNLRKACSDLKGNLEGASEGFATCKLPTPTAVPPKP